MADPNDYAYVLSGATDLVGCVLEDGDFSSLQLAGRDFSKSKLKKAKFSDANLQASDFSQADVSFADFRNADLRGAKFSGALYRVNFSNANLMGAKLNGLFHECNLSDASAAGADFRNARFQEGCNFSNLSIDEFTRFDAAEILRPYSSLPPFQYYRLERGKLFRISDISAAGVTQSQQARNAVAALDEGLRVIAAHSGGMTQPERATIGHNAPPLDYVITEADRQEAIEAFSDARDELSRGIKNENSVKRAISAARMIIADALRWVGRHADAAIGAFATEVGKTAGSKITFLAISAKVTGVMDQIISLLSQLGN